MASRLLKDKSKAPKKKKPTKKPTKKQHSTKPHTKKPATTTKSSRSSKANANKSAGGLHSSPSSTPALTTIEPSKVPLVANAKAVSSNNAGAASQLSSGKADDGMSTGTLAGIIAAAVGGIALVALVALFVVRRSRKEKQRRIKSVLENDFEEFEDAASQRPAYRSTLSSNAKSYPSIHDMEAAQPPEDGRWASELVTEELQRNRRHSDVSKSMVSVNDTILLRGATTDANALSSLVDMESDESDSDESDDDEVDSPPPRGLAAPKKTVKAASTEFEFAELTDDVEAGAAKSASKETCL
ncbi:hypothetical protein DYB32_006663 [Aphanomyces invadans]|uniref:Uncharacterized protein n=1 Tax=Aphanomyces invadans TaxID=157072 RepID=A0A418AR37_9STRA|nr:hypothetical protein DYB32_006663 [Aphanomyces invadans]